MKNYFCLLFILLLCRCHTPDINNKLPAAPGNTWAMLGFEKVDSLNPILLPSSAQSFNCPVSKQIVNWEERNVLNPTAVIKDGKVYLLYRAQDKSGTSRIGPAEWPCVASRR